MVGGEVGRPSPCTRADKASFPRHHYLDYLYFHRVLGSCSTSPQEEDCVTIHCDRLPVSSFPSSLFLGYFFGFNFSFVICTSFYLHAVIFPLIYSLLGMQIKLSACRNLVKFTSVFLSSSSSHLFNISICLNRSSLAPTCKASSQVVCLERRTFAISPSHGVTCVHQISIPMQTLIPVNLTAKIIHYNLLNRASATVYQHT